MTQLFMILDGAAALVGTVRNVLQVDEHREIAGRPGTVIVSGLHAGTAEHAAINARYTDQTPARFAVALDDGAAVPTVTAGEFVFPTTRTFIPVLAKVTGIAHRPTLENGIETLIHTDPSGLVGSRPVSYKI